MKRGQGHLLEGWEEDSALETCVAKTEHWKIRALILE